MILLTALAPHSEGVPVFLLLDVEGACHSRNGTDNDRKVVINTTRYITKFRESHTSSNSYPSPQHHKTNLQSFHIKRQGLKNYSMQQKEQKIKTIHQC